MKWKNINQRNEIFQVGRERKNPQINLSHVSGVAETGLGGGLRSNIFGVVGKQHADNDKKLE